MCQEFEAFLAEYRKRCHATADELADILEVLDGRERLIIFQRFGLDGVRPRTLEEVGKKLGVTRERIRQVQNIALVKLRRALSKKETPLPTN